MKNIFLICLILPTALACSRSKDDNKSQLDVLAAKKGWKRSDTDINTNSNPAGMNLYYPSQACEKDDLYTFSNSNEVTIDNGEEQCNTSEPRTETSPFTLDTDNKKIVIKGITYEVAEITSTQLKFYRAVPATSSFHNVVYLYKPAN